MVASGSSQGSCEVLRGDLIVGKSPVEHAVMGGVVTRWESLGDIFLGFLRLLLAIFIAANTCES
jgi:hypothetical protein